MNEAKQKQLYPILAIFFALAGGIWVVYGFLSPRWILYPAIGVANLGIAYFCKRNIGL